MFLIISLLLGSFGHALAGMILEWRQYGQVCSTVHENLDEGLLLQSGKFLKLWSIMACIIIGVFILQFLEKIIRLNCGRLANNYVPIEFMHEVVDQERDGADLFG